MIEKGVCRTALATPGLFNTQIINSTAQEAGWVQNIRKPEPYDKIVQNMPLTFKTGARVNFSLKLYSETLYVKHFEL